jgi:hypothetical protein
MLGVPSLYAKMLADSRFHDFLLACDSDLADERQRQCCATCGARLDVSNYKRKPRGRPLKLGPEHDRRFSFCCRRDGCRLRATPPSLRFLGRRVYLAAIVVLIAILQSGVNASRIGRLAAIVAVPPRTIARWRRWWRSTFTATPFWQAARARLMPPVAEQQLPASLLERFAGDDRERLLALLRFLGPITGGRSAIMRG